MYTKKRDRLKLSPGIFVFAFSLMAASATAGDVKLEVTYGGAIASQGAEFVGPGFEIRRGGNSYSASTHLFWSPVVGGLRPFGGVDFMWTTKSQILEGSSTAISLGLGYNFGVGYSSSTVFCGIARYFEKISGELKSGESVSPSSESIGAVLGCNLKFPFFQGLDSLLGYKVHLKENQSYEGVSQSGENYTITGSGVTHVLYGGISIRL